jgi:probable rRNA maturation factor
VTGRREFERAAAAIRSLGAKARGSSEVGVTLIGGRRMAHLNRLYKGRRGAAEILTFAYGDESGSGGDGAAGDILLCWKKLAAAADGLGVSRRSYLLRLVAHGLAHLEGYTHGGDREAEKMEKRERRLLEGEVPERDMARLFGGRRQDK